MIEVEVYKVEHSQSERGPSTTTAYAANLATAQYIAKQGLGWYGSSGFSSKEFTVMFVFESIQEWNDHQKTKKERRSKITKLENEIKRLRAMN